MSWSLVLLLAAGAYAFKVLGLVIVGDRRLPPVLDRCLGLIPAALVCVAPIWLPPDAASNKPNCI